MLGDRSVIIRTRLVRGNNFPAFSSRTHFQLHLDHPWWHDSLTHRAVKMLAASGSRSMHEYAAAGSGWRCVGSDLMVDATDLATIRVRHN